MRCSMSDIAPDRFSRLPERYRERSRQIAARVGEIDGLLRPAHPSEVSDVLKRLRSQLRPQPDTDVRGMAEGFKDSCRDLPAWALSEAANDFLAGRVENHTGQFMPTCAEFAKRARSILLPFLSERASLRIEAGKLVERAEDEVNRHRIEMERMDPSVKARVSALVSEVMAGTPSHVPLRGSLDGEKQKRLDALKKPRKFVSKIGHEPKESR